jgi:L-2-hydroxyglutarate oxidase LhgO
MLKIFKAVFCRFSSKKDADPVYDITIVGGGIIGMATAMKLSERYPSLKLAVVEKENALGKSTSTK